jgi:FkbM family methyltransferase
MAIIEPQQFIDFASDASRPTYFFGLNEYAFEFARSFKVDAVIDDFAKPMAAKHLSVIRSSEIPAKSLVVVGVCSNYLASAFNIVNRGDIDCCHYVDIARAFPEKVKQISQLADSETDFNLTERKYTWVRSLLEDEVSLRTWDALVDFRVNANVTAMDAFEFLPEQQYFENFLPLGENEVFIDGGGFDGDTALRFSKFCPSYKEIHLFEPCRSTYEKALSNTEHLKNCHYYNQGLYSATKSLSFQADQGSSNTISNEGSESISVTSLDSINGLAPTFIKLDIEGAELEALKGMEGYIRSHHPKLAIAIYHKARDFWELPEYVFSLYEGYSLLVRHYTEGWAETVMYFVPEDS